MTIESSVIPASIAAGAGAVQGARLENCIVRRADGIYVDPAVSSATFQSAVDSVFTGANYFVGIDYATFLSRAFDTQGIARAGGMQRFARDIAGFAPGRRALYSAASVKDGVAEYQFGPLPAPNGAGKDASPASLDADEFVAELWCKGIRFGIDIDAVRAAIRSGASDRITVARRLEPVPGEDAQVIEVCDDLHRSDAPRQLANGKLDLMAFQNRFPQIQQGKRLLKKVPLSAGTRGVDLSGKAIEPAPGADVDLAAMAGPGTRVEHTSEGEFLVALQAGFLNVDPASGKVAVGDKIVSRDGVSARTTGNLNLAADYEEFGEVQEKRVIEGEGITVHADVFGSIVSRGGSVQLNSNLVGGSAHNARGDIHVKGVASAAVVQAACGTVFLVRAESCVITGSRVVIEHAVNCEIAGDDIEIAQAEGCAVAGRRIVIESAGPRKQNEMQVFVLTPDCARIDEVIVQIGARVDEFAQLVERRKSELNALAGQEDVRRYMALAAKVRKGELKLTAEQAPQFQKMGAAVAPALKAIGQLSDAAKAAETERQAGAALLEQLRQQRRDSAGENRINISMLTGETVVRALPFQPDHGSIHDRPARDIKARLRAAAPGGDVIFSGSAGSVEWQG